jgi:hypothetical protein
MLKTILIVLTSLWLVNTSADKSIVRLQQKSPDNQSGTQEKMIVASGSVAMAVDLSQLNGSKSRSQHSTLHFIVSPDRFFTIIVFNGELRGAELGSMGLIPQDYAQLPAPLNASLNQLVIERTGSTDPYELVVRDGQTGFTFFNIEGNIYDYDAKAQLLSIKEGRLLVSKEFAAKLGRPSQAGAIVGDLSISATMRAIEITQVVNGEVRSAVMPPVLGLESPTLVGGPDVIVGDLSGLAQFGSSSGTQVGLAVGTDSCNAGAVPLNWLALPNNDHPVIPQNLYRLSGGATNDDRFEQIGQSNVKHAFTALQENICGFGCNATASTTLGAGCSDPYTASLNSGQSGNSLGSRAWINPFTGAYPRGDSATPPNTHTSHVHTGPSHRILVEVNDLNTSLNAGATYYAEAQYVTPHEYAWCVANPGQCNMNNNASYRQFSVSGTVSPFSFAAVGTTLRSKSALAAWTGSTSVLIQPDSANDGIGRVAYKVTNPSPGVWHYEYAVYNQNLDRAIQSFKVPLGAGITVSNIGFHAPPQHPGWTFDGTVGNTGYSSTPWTPVQTSKDLTWSSQTLAQNPNANAIRWGTLYNFRFDSDRPPTTTNATVGFFKTGAPIFVQILAPTPLSSISINDVSIIEGNTGTSTLDFTVSLSPASSQTVTVQYATADNTATAGSDYVGTSGTVTFAPGDTSKPVSVTINGDTSLEPAETFFVNLTSPTNSTIGDSQGVGTITDDDSHSISGHINYADGSTPGKNVTMTLTGTGGFVTRTTTTDTNGDYTFANVPVDNDYTVTPSKIGDNASGLQSFDAAFASRYVAGLDIPTTSQRTAADADDDGVLTSFDASFIARRAAGLPDTGIVGTWKFVPVNRAYPALATDQFAQNFAAILVGDTSGDWTPARPAGGGDPFKASAHLDATLAVSLPHVTGPMGSTLIVPITVGALTGQGVKAYDVQVTFNPAIVQPDRTPTETTGTLSSTMLITPNATNPGHLIVSAFQATDLVGGPGTLINLRFRIVGALGQVSNLDFQDYTDPGTIFHPGFRFKAGTPVATPTNGSAHVGRPTAATSMVSRGVADEGYAFWLNILNGNDRGNYRGMFRQ